MKILNVILTLILLTGCGAKIQHQISGINDVKIAVGPNFKEAAEFCDSRYGYKTEESEKCFLDFRNYYTLKLGIDTDSMEDFCNQYYQESSSSNISDCIDDLTSIFLNFKKG